MRIAAIQHDIEWEQFGETIAAVAPLIERAAGAGAELIVLPEMFATGFSMSPERIAEDEGGPIESFLLDQAHRYGACLLSSIAQRGADGAFRNNAVLARPDGTVERYAKIHPFTFAGEHEHYAAGERHLTVTVGGLRISVFICYDLRFADEFWTRAHDTDAYVVVANWPAARHEHWRILLRARAIENQAYVIGVNRSGSAPDLHHDGGSVVLDPMGDVVCEAGKAPQILLAEINSDAVRATRTRYPFLSDRRVLSDTHVSRPY